jgi:hypothetical protein
LRLELATLPHIDEVSSFAQTADYDHPFGERKLSGAEWVMLDAYALHLGLSVTSTLAKSEAEKKEHNLGSAHALGRAIDVRTRDRTRNEINQLITFLMKFNITIRDERLWPFRQKTWKGPHLHIETPKPGRLPQPPLLSPYFPGTNEGTRVPDSRLPIGQWLT